MTEVISETILNLDSFIREADATIDVQALPQLKGDTELLKRLCQNLIGNAIKYRRKDVKPVIRIYAETDGGTIRVIFEDNGIGVDPRFAKKIFDVFQRLHRMKVSIRAQASDWRWPNGSPRATAAPSRSTRHSRKGRASFCCFRTSLRAFERHMPDWGASSVHQETDKISCRLFVGHLGHYANPNPPSFLCSHRHKFSSNY